MTALKSAPQCVIDKPEDALTASGDVNQIRMPISGQCLRRGERLEWQLHSIKTDDANSIAHALATSRQCGNAVHVCEAA
jgi:hypothetical protein